MGAKPPISKSLMLLLNDFNLTYSNTQLQIPFYSSSKHAKENEQSSWAKHISTILHISVTTTTTSASR